MTASAANALLGRLKEVCRFVIKLHYYAGGALFDALPAGYAFCLVDAGKAPGDAYSPGRADPGAESAADTAALAGRPYQLALCVGGAAHRIGGVIGDKLDKSVRTYAYALPARLALLPVDDRKTVYYPYGVKLADKSAGPEAAAAVGASLCAVSRSEIGYAAVLFVV